MFLFHTSNKKPQKAILKKRNSPQSKIKVFYSESVRKMNFLSMFVLLNLLLNPSQQANVSVEIFRFFTVTDSICFLFLQTYKDFRVQRSIDCQPKNETYPVKMSDMKILSVNDTIFFSGKIEVLEDLPTKIDLEIQLIRCNLDSSGCIFFSKTVFSRICEKIEVKTSLTYKITRGISPTPTCPVKKNTYELMNDANINLDMFRTLPLEGFMWRSRYMFYEKNGLKRSRALACVENDIAVINKTRRPKPKI